MRTLLYMALLMGLLTACSASEDSESAIMARFDKIATGLPKQHAQLHKQGQLLICLPKVSKSKQAVLLIFGGMYYATPEFMLKNTPSELFEQAILVFAPCRYQGGAGFDATKKQLDKFLKKQGIGMQQLAVCGFSGGGPDALEASGADLKIVGLIDAEPLLPKKKSAKYPDLIVAFNKLNWSDNEYYGAENKYKHFTIFANWAKKQGGKVEENKVKHEWFPKYFLYKYRRKLI